MRIGLFFGSFNPIHIGHLAIANYIVEFGDIHQLWFVVSPHNPLKKKGNLLDDYQRLEMVHRAIDDDHRFSACDIEFRLPKPSYTINTLAYLKEKYPKHEFVLIIGADNYVSLKKWKNYEVLIQDYQFMVYPRPGFNLEDVDFVGKFTIINAPLIEISSTFIRESIAQRHDMRHFLSSPVFKYIEEMAFYT